jgi:hypothetical protein
MVATAPAFFIYDCACLVAKRLEAMTAFAAAYRALMVRTTLLVDRFHFKGHSPRDEFCRTRCNPLAHNLPGLVTHVVPRRMVSGPGDDPALSSVEGVKSTFMVRLP